MKKIIILIIILFALLPFISAQESPNPYVIGGMNYFGSAVSGDNETQCNYSVGQAVFSDNKRLEFASANKTVNITTGFPYGILYLSAAFKGDLFCSKGYHSDYIRLRWEVGKYSESIEEFQIYRAKVGEQDSFLVANVAAGIRIYKDIYAEAGVLYKYTVYAKGVHPQPQKGINYIQGIGFRNPTGIVTGRITYAGGTAVENVEVLAESETALKGHSLYFDGNDYIYAEHKDGTVSADNFSFQAYIQFENTLHDACFFAKGNQYAIWYNNSNKRLIFDIGDDTFSAAYTPPVDDYFQLTTVYDGDSAFIYTDGELTGKGKIRQKPETDDAIIILGKNSETGHYLTGYLDEVRVWKKALSQEEVERDYSRILSGGEDNMTIYWMFDEGIGEEFYDKSKTGYDYNKNHGEIVNALWSETIPREEQLYVKGITDNNGNYIISGIPYETDGSTYTFTPAFGVHSFDPKKSILFIGEGSTIHNNINFTDISSFRVTGTAFYRNTTYPLKDAILFVDGKEVMGPDNLPVKTDVDGEFDIDVPIGDHYIAVKKKGHTFENNGQWPSPTDDQPYKKHNFQEPVSGIEFVDTTLIKVAGRVVGGTREGDKPVGFGKSLNNIGTSKIDIESEKSCDLDVKDTTIFNTLTYNTNQNNGEYIMHLLPEKYIVNFVGNDTYSIPQDDLSILDLTNSHNEDYDLDSTEIKTIENGDTTISYEVDTFYYQLKKNYIIRVRPTIAVINPETDEDFFAEESIIVSDPDDPKNEEKKDTIDLKNNSPFLYPIFKMGKVYKTKIKLYEEYINPDYNGEHTLVAGQYAEGPKLTDQVPVTDATITINNHLEYGEPAYSVKPKSDGTYDYEFRGGIPNFSTDESNKTSFTKTFEVDIKTETHQVKWRDGNLFRGYILGEKAKGNNFLTKGPEIPEIILRDPPGTNSYAYIEQGSSYTVTQNWSSSFGLDKSYDNSLSWGINTKMLLGLTTIVETESKTKNSLGLKLNYSFDENGQFGTTYEFKERIQTSSDPYSVGSLADLYIGKAYNVYFGESDNLRILTKSFADDNGLNGLGNSELSESGSKYTLAVRPGFIISPDTANTYFVYSQNHIINYLIPNLVRIRNNLFVNSPQKYKSNLDASDKYYGLNNDNAVFDDCDTCDSENPSYEFFPESDNEVDSVRVYNQQISIWMGVIQINEAEKANASLMKNLSIDGTAGSYSETFSKKIFGSKSSQVKHNIEVNFGNATSLKLNSLGLSIASKTSLKWSKSAGGSDSYQKGITFGYVINDNNHGDYYSIDVKDPNEDGLFTTNVDNFLSSNNNIDTIARTIKGTSGGLASFSIIKSLSKITNANVAVISQGVNMYVDLMLSISAMCELKEFTDSVKSDYKDSVTVSGWNISGPVFATKGGQTMCPYEGGEYTSFFIDSETGKPFELNKATVQREVPIIDVEPTIVSEVPEYSKAVFELKIRNESESQHDMWYSLRMDEKSNPHGAVVKIDGTSPNKSIYVPFGSTVTKTLTINKGPGDVMNYDSICMILHSPCQFDPTDNYPDIADSVYFSAHFIPTCTPVRIKNLQDGWILNADDKDTLFVTLDQYDLNHKNFEEILFQYKTLSGSPITNMVFYKNESDFDESDPPKTYINGNPSINYFFPMENLVDRQYQIRAKTLCSDGSVYESPFLTGIKDSKYPKLFGAPSPADGILSPNDEIMIRFDEQIEAGLVSKLGNIEFTGVLNGAELNHGAAVAIDDLNEKVSVNEGINLTGKSFTVEFWLNRLEWTSSGIFFRIGNDRNAPFQFGYSPMKQLYVEIEGTRLVLEKDFEDKPGWYHVACTYNNENREAILYFNGEVAAYASLDKAPEMQGRITFGEISYYHTAMHELRMWEYERSRPQISSNMNFRLTGQEEGLVGYWRLDEAIGTLCRDYAGNRHAMMDDAADWLVQPYSYACKFEKMGNYLEINSGTIPVTDEMDFTIEFWVRLNGSGRDAYIFSNGKGDGTDSRPQSAWSAYFDENGYIQLNHKGLTHQASKNDLHDNGWHHFALVVNRLGTVKTYVDGDLQTSFEADSVGGFAGSRIWLGARGWFQGSQIMTDNTFFGSIDEFRVWNLARTHEQIKRDMVHKLSGTETGLLAYFPFENYVEDAGVFVSDTTFMDQSFDDEGNTHCGYSVANDGISLSLVSPKIKRPRPVEKVNYDFAINVDKMIITPNEPAARIENCVLDVTVRDVFDLHGNRLQSPVTWTAYIDKNQVVWADQGKKLEKELYDPLSFTTEIVNKGGTRQYFMIKNLPVWLKATPAQGYIDPDSRMEVTFVVNEGLNIGSYSQDIYLEADIGFNEKYHIDLRVSKTPPDWQVDPEQYEYSMNLFGRLSIEGVFSADIYDKVAVFENDTCRGVANVTYFEQNDEYLVFLDVYSNVPIGEKLAFKVWDASKGQVYVKVEPELIFQDSKVMGSPTNPIIIDAKNLQVQTIGIQKGWNWFSLNLQSDNPGDRQPNMLLRNLYPEEGDMIMTKNYFDQYSEKFGQWIGSLSDTFGIKDWHMCMLKMGHAGNIEFAGKPFQNLKILMTPGWNWIAYLPQVSMSVNDALAFYDATQGDIIKSQKNFAMFDDDLGWVGSLEYMEPGNGYKLYSALGKDFTYPEKGLLKSLHENKEEILTGIPHWNYDEADSRYDMTLVARLSDKYDKTISDDALVVGAFVDNKCLGHAFPENIHGDNYYFLRIHTNTAGLEDIQFRLYNRDNSKESVLLEQMDFLPDHHTGTFKNPFLLHTMKTMTEVMNISGTQNEVFVNPNPFDNLLNVSLHLNNAYDVEMSLYDVPGKLIKQLYTGHTGKGWLRKEFRLNGLNGPELQPGIYFLKVRTGYTENVIKLVKN